MTPPPPAPLYSVSVWSTPHNSIWDDIAQIAGTGARGIGLWEGKFDAVDTTEAIRDAIAERRLRVTSCAPRIWTILPLPWASRTVPRFNFSHMETDPGIRTRLICESLPRLACFEPDCILIGTGPCGELSKPAALDVVVDGLARIAEAASALGLRVGFELTSARRGSPVSRLSDMARLIDVAGRRNIGVIVDVFHSAGEPGIHDELREFADRIAGVHVNDLPREERGPYDRVLPGDGRATASRFLAPLLAAQYRGWYELEVFSDDGTFGSVLPDSLWAIPHEALLRRGLEAFERSYRTAWEIAHRGD